MSVASGMYSATEYRATEYRATEYRVQCLRVQSIVPQSTVHNCDAAFMCTAWGCVMCMDFYCALSIQAVCVINTYIPQFKGEGRRRQEVLGASSTGFAVAE